MEEKILNVSGFENRDLKIVDRGVFRAAVLCIDGREVVPEKGVYILRDNSGRVCEGKFQYGFFLDPYRKMVLNGQRVEIRPPLKWYQYMFAGWPLLMIFIGGAIGGGVGAAAAHCNIRLFRSRMNIFLKYFVTFVISLAAFMVWLLLALIIQQKYGN